MKLLRNVMIFPMILIGMSSCGVHKPKFKVGDCLKGNAYLHRVQAVYQFTYSLKLLDPRMPYLLSYKHQVAHRAFKKVECPK